MADLETPEPAPEPVAATPPAEPTPEPESPLDLAEIERSIDKEGVTQVDARALKAARAEAREAKKQADQLAGWVNQAKPYIEFLSANPGLMTRTTQETQPSPVTTTQPSDDKAEILARTLDLYTADGKPDVKRAQTIRQMISSEASEQADLKVKPLQESTTRERANYNYQRALITKSPDGRTVDRETLDAIWKRTDPTILAQEEGAAGVVAMALGLAVMRGSATTPTPLAPVLHTEAPGSRTQTRQTLSQLDEQIAKLRGIDTKTYAERTKGFTPGRQNVLED